jgi:hypothetical protein
MPFSCGRRPFFRPSRRDGVHGGIQVVRLAGEEDRVVAGLQLLRDDGLHGKARVAVRAFDDEAVARNLLASFRAHKEGHVRGIRLREPPAEISADASGAQHQELQGFSTPSCQRMKE